MKKTVKAIYRCNLICGKPNLVAEMADGSYRLVGWRPEADGGNTFSILGDPIKMGYRASDFTPLSQADMLIIPTGEMIGKEFDI